MKKTITLALLALALSTTAQTNASASLSTGTDSLFNELKKWQGKTGIAADTNLYNIYYALGNNFEDSNPDTALYFYTKSIVYAKNQHDELKEGESIRKQGWCFFSKGDYSTTISYFNNALSLTKKMKIDLLSSKLKAEILGNIAVVFGIQHNNKKCLEYYNKALKINILIQDTSGVIQKLNEIGIRYYYMQEYKNALTYFNKALKISIQNNQTKAVLYNLQNIGLVYSEQGNIPKALEYYFKSLKQAEELNDKLMQAVNSGNIGSIYIIAKDYYKGKDYYLKAFELFKKINDKRGQAISLSNIGSVYTEIKEYNKALDYYYQSMKLSIEIGDLRGKALTMESIGQTLFEIGKENQKKCNCESDSGYFSKALENYKNASIIIEQIEDNRNLAINYGLIGEILIEQKNYVQAEFYLKKSILLGEEFGIINELKDFYLFYSELLSQTGRYKEAFFMYKKHSALNDSIQSDENKKAVIEKEMQFEFDKKEAIAKAEQEKKDALAKEELEKQTMQRNGFVGGFILMLALAGVVFRSYRNKQQANVIITKQKHEVEQQKYIIEEKHKEITDSINYAERIQRSFLATTEMLDQNLKDYFVFFRPKDVVSGDFYWAGELNNGNFAFSVADSTGHGVPGAIMSILNISSLEKSIEKETAPDQILNQTRKIIIERLKKDGSSEGGKDGMDCSLLVFNQDRTLLSFAAANNPVFIVRPVRHSALDAESVNEFAGQARNDGKFELIEFKPDKMPVGKHDNDAESFTLNTTLLQKGDVIYTLTDGFPDQFGGEKGKKYMIKTLKELLLQIAHLPVVEQEQKLADEFDKWKGENEQVDDVCIIGVRV